MVGSHTNLLSETYNAVLHAPEPMRVLLKRYICIVLYSNMQDCAYNELDTFLLAGERPKLFFECLSSLVDKTLNNESDPVAFIREADKLQQLFVNWSVREQKIENVGLLLAASSRDERSVFFCLHDFVKQVFENVKKKI